MGNENSYAVNFAINTSVNPVCTAFTKDYTVIASHAIIVFKTLKKLGLLTPGGGGGGGGPTCLGSRPWSANKLCNLAHTY